MKQYKRIFISILIMVIPSLYIIMPSKERPRPRALVLLNESVEMDNEDLFREVARDVFIHSAFWDQRQNRNIVRILAIAPRMDNETRSNFECFLNYGRYAIRAELYARILIEHWNLNHTAVFYTCVAHSDIVPLSVALTKNVEARDLTNTSIIWKAVQNLTFLDRKFENLAVCVRPFFGPFNDTFQLAEFVAYYSSMGVTHFHFLDLDTSFEVKKFIAALQNAQPRTFTINFQPWNLPTNLNIWQFGQVAANQYCVLKLMPRYKYVALVDLDEFIVPRTPNRSLLTLIWQKDMSWIGSFMFRNVFFSQGAKDSETNQRFGVSRILNYRVRNRQIWKPRERSKVIVKPETVLEQTIHFVGRSLRGHASLVLDATEALLHHYRNVLWGMGNDTLIDTYASDHYGHMVKSSKVLEIWKDLFLGGS